MVANVARAQGPAFNCNDGLAYIITNVAGGTGGNTSSLRSLNLGNGQVNTVVSPIFTSGVQFVNAAGYNSVDNYIWGYRVGTSQVARIAADGTATAVNVVIQGGTTPMPTSNSSTGDISRTGVLYITGNAANSTTYAINLNGANATTPATYTTVTWSGAGMPAGLNDWAFSPVDNNIYGMTTGLQLYRFSPSTGASTLVSTMTGLPSSSYGTAFMDSEGNMYVGNNNTGLIYRILRPDQITAPSTAVTLYNSSLSGQSPGDGARCPNSGIPPSANNDNIFVTPPAPANVTANIVSNDGTGTFPLNTTSGQLINPATGLPAAGNTVTIAGQGTFSLNAGTGVVTFTPVSGFTRATVTYTIQDTQGNTSSPATISVSLNPTANNDRACVPSGQTTVSIDVTTNDVFPGYSVAANGVTLVAPTTISGQGSFSVSGNTVTFTAVTGFTETSVRYTVRDTQGGTSGQATLTVGRCGGPTAIVDRVCLTAPLTTTLIVATLNDVAGTNLINPASVRLVNGANLDATSFTAPNNQGTFAVNTATGVVTFTPPTPSSAFGIATAFYTVKDVQGIRSDNQAAISVGLCDGTLPVTLVSFSAEAEGTAIALRWRTAQERGFDRFELERSTDLRLGYERIATVRPHADGQGGSYAHNDTTAQPGQYYYYRLRKIDTDSTYQYSNVAVARWQPEQALVVYPNPARDRLTVLSASAMTSLRLVSATGQTVSLRIGLDAPRAELSLAGVKAGVYVLQITTKNGAVQTEKVLVE